MTNSTSVASSDEEGGDDCGFENNNVTKKDPGAFRTISEVADEIHVPQHVLRFWETRFTQVQPVKRSGGRRYYRTEDIDLLKYISELLYVEGYTIKGVQRLLDEDFSKFTQKSSPKGKDVEEDPKQAEESVKAEMPVNEPSLATVEKEIRDILEQKSIKDSQQIDRLKEENTFLIHSIETILLELQELRKIIANS